MKVLFLCLFAGMFFLSSCGKEKDRVTLSFGDKKGQRDLCILFENGGSSAYQPLNVRIWSHGGNTVYQWKANEQAPVLTALFEGLPHEAKVLYLYGYDRTSSGEKNLHIIYKDGSGRYPLDLFSAKGLIKIDNPGTDEMTLFTATEEERKKFMEKLPSEMIFLNALN